MHACLMNAGWSVCQSAVLAGLVCAVCNKLLLKSTKQLQLLQQSTFKFQQELLLKKNHYFLLEMWSSLLLALK